MNTVAICLGIKQWIPPVGNVRMEVAPEMNPEVKKTAKHESISARGMNAVETRIKNRKTVIDLLSTGVVFYVSDICAETGLSRNNVRRHLIALVSEGIAATNPIKSKCTKVNPAKFWRAK